jgi:hypothetical protein
VSPAVTVVDAGDTLSVVIGAANTTLDTSVTPNATMTIT